MQHCTHQQQVLRYVSTLKKNKRKVSEVDCLQFISPQAAVRAVQIAKTKKVEKLILHTDSQYLINGNNFCCHLISLVNVEVSIL